MNGSGNFGLRNKSVGCSVSALRDIKRNSRRNAPADIWASEVEGRAFSSLRDSSAAYLGSASKHARSKRYPSGQGTDITQVRVLSLGLLNEIQEFGLQKLGGHFKSRDELEHGRLHYTGMPFRQ